MTIFEQHYAGLGAGSGKRFARHMRRRNHHHDLPRHSGGHRQRSVRSDAVLEEQRRINEYLKAITPPGQLHRLLNEDGIEGPATRATKALMQQFVDQLLGPPDGKSGAASLLERLGQLQKRMQSEPPGKEDGPPDTEFGRAFTVAGQALRAAVWKVPPTRNGFTFDPPPEPDAKERPRTDGPAPPREPASPEKGELHKNSGADGTRGAALDILEEKETVRAPRIDPRTAANRMLDIE